MLLSRRGYLVEIEWDYDHVNNFRITFFFIMRSSNSVGVVSLPTFKSYFSSNFRGSPREKSHRISRDLGFVTVPVQISCPWSHPNSSRRNLEILISRSHPNDSRGKVYFPVVFSSRAVKPAEISIFPRSRANLKQSITK